MLAAGLWIANLHVSAPRQGGMSKLHTDTPEPASCLTNLALHAGSRVDEKVEQDVAGAVVCVDVHAHGGTWLVQRPSAGMLTADNGIYKIVSRRGHQVEAQHLRRGLAR